VHTHILAHTHNTAVRVKLRKHAGEQIFNVEFVQNWTVSNLSNVRQVLDMSRLEYQLVLQEPTPVLSVWPQAVGAADSEDSTGGGGGGERGGGGGGRGGWGGKQEGGAERKKTQCVLTRHEVGRFVDIFLQNWEKESGSKGV